MLLELSDSLNCPSGMEKPSRLQAGKPSEIVNHAIACHTRARGYPGVISLPPSADEKEII